MLNRAGTETNIKTQYSILEPTINQLRGIRYMVPDGSEGEGAGEETEAAVDETAETENPDTKTETAENEGQEPEKEPAKETPKAGDQDAHDPVKAQKLIDNLRADKQREKDAKLGFKAEVDSLQQELDEVKDKLKKFEDAENERNTGEKKKELLTKYNLPSTWSRFLTGDKAEEWEDAAKDLAAERGNSEGGTLQQSGRTGTGTREEKIIQANSKRNTPGF